jgi:chromosome segregation ATPase
MTDISPSPVKGLDRLSNELRLERQKCTAALQERSKLKIEIEKLKSENADLEGELSNSIQELKQFQNSSRAQEIKIKELEDDLNSKTEEIKVLQSSLLSVKSDVKQNRDALSKTTLDGQSAKELEQFLRSKVSELEILVGVKDNTINEMKDEMERLKRVVSITESKNNEIMTSLNSRQREFDEMRGKALKVDSLTRNFNDIQRTSEQMKNELESSILKITEISHKLREANEKNYAHSITEQQQNEAIADLQTRESYLSTELDNTMKIQSELMKRLEAEVEATKIARSQLENSVKTISFQDVQINDLREAHERALQRCGTLEDEVNTLRKNAIATANELAIASELAQQRDTALAEAAGKHVLMAEVESLRNQLADVRRKMIKKDIDEDLEKLSPLAVMEREKSNRKMYEGIIEELRIQLDKANLEVHDKTQRLSESLSKLSRIEELEEELLIYKEAAKTATAESNR